MRTKTKKMTRWGIGPRFAILTLLYSALIYLVHKYLLPTWEFVGFETMGIVLMAGGFLLFIYPAVTIDKYFNNGRLRTKGLYAIVRHPIYAAWVILIIPGIVLYSGSTLAITIPFVAYLILKNLIHVEEDYLQRKFGKAYISYKARVNAVFPKLF
jgi:protein-S-isoprenylcysteine O-methyltransferase Ste14